MGCQPPLKLLLLGFGQFGLTRLRGDTVRGRLCQTNPLIDAERDNLSQRRRQIHASSMGYRTSNMGFGYLRMEMSYHLHQLVTWDRTPLLGILLGWRRQNGMIAC